MAEWLKAIVLKIIVLNGTVGSNPSLSYKIIFYYNVYLNPINSDFIFLFF